MTRNPCWLAVLALVSGITLCARPMLAGDETVTWTGEGNGTSWSDAENWSTDAFPNNNGTAFDAIVTDTVEVDLDVEPIVLDGLTVGANATVRDTSSADELRLGADSVNDGVIRVGTFGVNDNLILGGAGTVMPTTQASFTGRRRLFFTTDTDGTLTIGANQTIDYGTDGTSGFNVNLVNNGLITKANPDEDSFSTFQDGRTLVNNGTIATEDTSAYEFEGTSDHHGVLDSTGGGRFLLSEGTFRFQDGSSVIGDGRVEIGGFRATVNLQGAVTNDAAIRATNEDATIAIDGDATLDGEGRFIFENDVPTTIGAANPDDTLTIGPDQTVTTKPTGFNGPGQGIISANLINEGTIDADAGVIELTGAVENGSTTTLAATSGGTLRVNNTLTGGGTVEVEADSTVEIANAGDAIDNTFTGPGELLFKEGEMTVNGPVQVTGELRVGDGAKFLGDDNFDANVTFNQPLLGHADFTVDSDDSTATLAAGGSEVGTLENLGTLEIAGSTTATGDADFALFATFRGVNGDPSSDVLTVEGATQVNSGTWDGVTVVAAGGGTNDASTLDMLNGATLEVPTGQTWVNEAADIEGGGRIENFGTWNTDRGSSSAFHTLEADFINHPEATVTLESSPTIRGSLTNEGSIAFNENFRTLSIEGESTTSGSFTVGAENEITFGAPVDATEDVTHTLTESGAITGAGDVTFNGAGTDADDPAVTADINGTFQLTGEESTTTIQNGADVTIDVDWSDSLGANINVDDSDLTLRIGGDDATADLAATNAATLQAAGADASGYTGEPATEVDQLDINNGSLTVEQIGELGPGELTLLVEELRAGNATLKAVPADELAGEPPRLIARTLAAAISPAAVTANNPVIVDGLDVSVLESLEVGEGGAVDVTWDSHITVEYEATANVKVGATISSSDQSGELTVKGEATVKSATPPPGQERSASELSGLGMNIEGQFSVEPGAIIETDQIDMAIREGALVRLGEGVTFESNEVEVTNEGGAFEIDPNVDVSGGGTSSITLSANATYTIGDRAMVEGFDLHAQDDSEFWNAGLAYQALGENETFTFRGRVFVQEDQSPGDEFMSGFLLGQAGDMVGGIEGNYEAERQIDPADDEQPPLFEIRDEQGNVEFSLGQDFKVTQSPGQSPGQATLTADTVQFGSELTTVIELAGHEQGETFDLLKIIGELDLGGHLELALLDDFDQTITPDDEFTIITSEGIAGVFDNVAPGQRLLTADGSGSFEVQFGPNSPFNPDNVVLSNFIPEPGTAVLLALGTLTLLQRRRGCWSDDPFGQPIRTRKA